MIKGIMLHFKQNRTRRKTQKEEKNECFKSTESIVFIDVHRNSTVRTTKIIAVTANSKYSFNIYSIHLVFSLSAFPLISLNKNQATPRYSQIDGDPNNLLRI